jgi:transcriptional regulator of acetoin/glycerol metabolism
VEHERDRLLRCLEECRWNVARAAKQLGMSRMTLYRRLRERGISRATAQRC